RVYGAATLWHLGYPDQALRSAQAALSLARELSSPFNVAQALYYGAFTHLCRREVNQVQALAASLMELSQEHDFALLFAGGMILHGWALTEQGRMEEGTGQMREGLTRWRATGALSHRPYHLALLAEALARDGRAEEGLTAVAEALAMSAATKERFWEAELHRRQGELTLARASADPSALSMAEVFFLQSLGVARRQCARSLELRAVMSLARLARSQGQPAEM